MIRVRSEASHQRHMALAAEARQMLREGLGYREGPAGRAAPSSGSGACAAVVIGAPPFKASPASKSFVSSSGKASTAAPSNCIGAGATVAIGAPVFGPCLFPNILGRAHCPCHRLRQQRRQNHLKCNDPLPLTLLRQDQVYRGFIAQVNPPFRHYHA